MSQVTQCDICKCIADTNHPIMEERWISLKYTDVCGEPDMRFHYYFTLPTGEYHSPEKIDICDECAELGHNESRKAADGRITR